MKYSNNTKNAIVTPFVGEFCQYNPDSTDVEEAQVPDRFNEELCSSYHLPVMKAQSHGTFSFHRTIGYSTFGSFYLQLTYQGDEYIFAGWSQEQYKWDGKKVLQYDLGYSIEGNTFYYMQKGQLVSVPYEGPSDIPNVITINAQLIINSGDDIQFEIIGKTKYNKEKIL